MNIEMLQQQEAGIVSRLAELRQQEAIFIKAATIEEQVLNATDAVGEAEAEAKKARNKIKTLKVEKAKALESSISALRDRMAQVLPFGSPLFDIEDDGSISFGWDMGGGKMVPYGGLSGGQRVQFEAALCFALLQGKKNPLIIAEGAELGLEIPLMLEHIARSNPEAQIIVNTCYPVDYAPDGWDVVNVSFSEEQLRNTLNEGSCPNCGREGDCGCN